MNNYNIKIGSKTYNAKGVNLETALIDLGLTDITIQPQWRGKSNGKYIAKCSEYPIVYCTWLNKKFQQ